jgi:hypothetical protein
MQSSLASLNLPALRQQLQQDGFARLSGGQGGINLSRWQELLQNLPGAAANNAGVQGTATASAADAAFRSLDTDGNGQLSQAEFNAALDKMLAPRRRQPAATPLEAHLLGQQQASGGVAAPDILRRMLLGYGAGA